MFDNRVYVYHDNKILYHAILLGSFVAAIKLIPLITEQLAKYVQNEIVLWILPYVVAYLGAIYLLPELGFFLAKSSSEE